MRLVCILLFALAAATGPAQAGLAVCNKGAHPARVALGRFDGKAWMSEGWWKIAPNTCADLIKTPLDARFYYLYGTDTASGVWDGGTSFCTAPTDKFAITGRGNCAGRGYDRKRFFPVDTQDSLNKIQTLQ